MRRLIAYLEDTHQLLYPRTFIAVQSVLLSFVAFCFVMAVRAFIRDGVT
jgi:hypothetical protein